MKNKSNITEHNKEMANPETKIHESLQKPERKITDNFIFCCIAAFLLITAGQFLGTVVVFLIAGAFGGISTVSFSLDAEDIVVSSLNPSPLMITLSNYIVFIGIWIITILWLLRKNNRPILKSIGTSEKGNTISMFLLGLLIGFVMNGLCILAGYLHGDIHMYYDSFKPLPLLIIFISVFIQSSAEELVCRGYLYRKLLNRYSPTVAIIVSSLFFSYLHIGNSGIGIIALISLFAVGLLLALIVYYFDSIWCAFAVHTAWNFTQNIIFGLPNSGIVSPFSILKLDTATASNSLFYNVGFGVEGTIFAIVIIVIACVLVTIFGRRKKQRELAM